MTTAVTFHATEADYVAASRDAYLASIRRPATLLRLSLLVIVVVAVTLYALGGGTVSDALFLVPFMIAAVPLGIAINLLWLPRKVRRMFRQQPAYAEPMSCHWSTERFGMTTPLSTIDLRWDQLFRWRETARSLLFYITDFQLVFVPKRALSSADLADLRALLHAHVPRR